MQLTLPSGQTLAFDQYGYAIAPAVILLHGLSGSRRTWEAVVEHLGPHYLESGQLQVLTVDLRGHGESGRAPADAYDAPSYAADIAALIENLPEGGRPAILVGHSLGGVVGATLATTRPELVRGLFLEDPPLYEADAARRATSPAAKFFPAMVAAVRDLQSRNAGPEEYRALVATASAPDEVEERCQTLAEWDPATMEAAISGLIWQGYDPTVPLPCPVTVVRADPAVGAVFEPGDAERFLATNPDADVEMVPGASHSVHATATLEGWLRQLHIFLTNL